MKKATKPTPAVHPLTVVAPVPPAFQGHAKEMSEFALQIAVKLGADHPAIVQAAVEFSEAYGRAGEKFFNMASALRAAKLQKKESTLLMLGLGFSKSRASEMLRLSSVSDEIWAQYSTKAVGFRAALALDKPKAEVPPVEPGAENARQSNVVKAEKADFDDAAKAGLQKVFAGIKRPLKNGKPTDYKLELFVDGVKFDLYLTATQKA